ncbi:hypothetical protein OCU04_000922 [Sclerotinia nivalis]|uniref:Uncharacterized protein n=1 Tax=Sclerotinia nivalis TaxID=352851 RepID=A0A9X0DRL5_9HELO|nr:hypothetical protein OCU04_000922 [Sclerotinia nivalis]
MEVWSKVSLMHDNRVMSHVDMLGPLASEIMTKFTAPDQLRAINYLKNAPTNVHQKTVAIVEGFPGVGKTEFLAYVIVTMLTQQPKFPIACISAANQPTDVLASASTEQLKTSVLRNLNTHPF